MALPRQKLDDMEFDSFLEAVIKKIPEHSDDWTDYNVTDPGITILELLSWLASSQLFHIDQITDIHRIAFLKLLGCDPIPPRSSSYIGFLDNVTGDRYIPANCRLRDLIQNAECSFETGDAETISQVSIENISRSYLGKTDEELVMSEDGKIRIPLFSDDPDIDDVVTFTLKSGGSLNHRVRLYFDLYDMPSGKIPEDTEVYPTSYFVWEYEALVETVKVWKRFPKDMINDGTYCLSRSGILEFDAPGDISISNDKNYLKIRCRLMKVSDKIACFEKTPSLLSLKPNPIMFYDRTTLATISDVVSVNNPHNTAEIPIATPQNLDEFIVQYRGGGDDYWVDIVKDKDSKKYSLNPDASLPRIDVIAPDAGEVRALFPLPLPVGYKLEDTVHPVRKQNGYLTFSSTGLPGFTIKLPEPAMPGVIIQVECSPEKWVDWEETVDIRMVSKRDRRFSLSSDRKTILFGDGVNGVVPPRAINSSPNIWLVNYRIATAMKGEVYGLILFEKGNDSETINEARWRAVEEIASPPAAVTLDDYRDFAHKTPGVNIARTISVVKPVEKGDMVFSVQNCCLEPIQDDIGIVDLDCTGKIKNAPIKSKAIEKSDDVKHKEGAPHRIVVLVIPQTDKRPARPSDGTLRTVCEYLDQFRLVTTRLDVQPPVYIPIYINTTIAISPGFNRKDVSRAAGERLLRFLDPLYGGDDETGWLPGRSIYCYEIAAVLEGEPGVARVLDVSVRSPKQKTTDKTSGEIKMEWNHLPYLSAERVRINTFVGDETCN